MPGAQIAYVIPGPVIAMNALPDCPLCQAANPLHVIWRNDKLRVISVDDPDFPGYTRVIWNTHVSEMTELSDADRQAFMDVVWRVEAVMRSELLPKKVNLAQLGNMVPHLHWHIIPRWPLDKCFPDAVWATPRQATPEQELAWSIFQENLLDQLPAYRAALRAALENLPA